MPYIVGDMEGVRDNWQGDGTDAQKVEKWLDEREQQDYPLVAVIPAYHTYTNEGEPNGTRDPLLILHANDPSRNPT